ncbi:hypothetical protein L1887_36738 [Cichorium endivia]|nr:hypothetical protein L1887_36738 [Cichorium endivia]
MSFSFDLVLRALNWSRVTPTTIVFSNLLTILFILSILVPKLFTITGIDTPRKSSLSFPGSSNLWIPSTKCYLAFLYCYDVKKKAEQVSDGEEIRDEED